MKIQQLSVFLENRKGRLTELTKILAANDINISAFSIADATDYGMLRLIVGRPELAKKVLTEHGFSVNVTEVACIIVPNEPGGLYKALNILSDNNIDIDYMYAFAMDGSAQVVIRSASTQQLIDVLQQNKVELLKASRFYQV